jgi:hypothetical protein
MKKEVNEKIKKVFNFLKANRQFNKEVQSRTYLNMLLPYQDNQKFEKVGSVLYQIANTQSRPNIDRLANFYISLYYENLSFFDTFESFVMKISNNDLQFGLSYHQLFTAMRNQSGWGDKTSALFVKTIYHIHNDEYDNRLKIWKDMPVCLKNDKLYLPVDAVILSIFNRIFEENRNFNNINNYLHDNFDFVDMEVWDDLWFWGFISQRTVKGNGRIFEWNENKYWSLLETNKSKERINDIELKVEEFLNILKGD